MNNALERIAELAPTSTGAELRVLIELSRRALPTGATATTISSRDLSEATKLSRSNTQAGIASLNKRGIVSSDRGSATRPATHRLNFLTAQLVLPGATEVTGRGPVAGPPLDLKQGHPGPISGPPVAPKQGHPGPATGPPIKNAGARTPVPDLASLTSWLADKEKSTAEENELTLAIEEAIARSRLKELAGDQLTDFTVKNIRQQLTRVRDKAKARALIGKLEDKCRDLAKRPADVTWGYIVAAIKGEVDKIEGPPHKPATTDELRIAISTAAAAKGMR